MVANGSITPRPAIGTQAQTHALWLNGSDTTSWLVEIDRWDVPLLELKVLLVAEEDGTAAGALAILPRGFDVPTETRAQRYTCVADRLYVPIECDVTPPFTRTELSGGIPAPDGRVDLSITAYLFRPRLGWTAFTQAQHLSVSDLFERPSRLGQSWTHAQPGVRLSSRLLAIEPESRIDADDVFEPGREAVGDLDLDELDEAPDESTSTAKNAQSWTQVRLAKLASWLTSKVPRTASKETWVDRLESWATRKVDAREDELQQRRFREVHRLLHWLKHDSERGLRFALPIDALDARGLARAGHRLSPNDVDFDLDRLAGGRPASPWSMPPELTHRLRTEYTRLANSEVGAERHRRAAYIHAHLLGDLVTAANVLRQGGHLREAAALYRERLDQPLVAADCLAEAGLYADALTIYVEHGCHDLAAKLCQELGRPDDARTHWRQAVDAYRQQSQWLLAGETLVEKLDAPDEAMALYEEMWNDAPNSQQLLTALLGLYGKHDGHHRATALARDLRQTQLGQRRTRDDQRSVRDTGRSDDPTHQDHRRREAIVAAITEVVHDYPARSVQLELTETAHHLIARALRADPDRREPGTRAIVAQLNALRPDDRLLGRDCTRFNNERPRRTPNRAQPIKRREMIEEFGRLRIAEWQSIVLLGSGFLAVGRRGAEVIATRFHLRGPAADPGSWQTVTWNDASRAPILVAAPPPDAAFAALPVVLALEGTSALAVRKFTVNDGFDEPLTVGSPPGFSASVTRAASYFDDGNLATVWASEKQTSVRTSAPNGDHLHTVEIPKIPGGKLHASGHGSVRVQARDADTFVTLGSTLLQIRAGECHDATALFDVARDMSCPRIGHETKLAVSLPQGGVVCFSTPSGLHLHPFASGQTSPVIHYRVDETLLSAASGELIAYDTGHRRVTERRRIAGPWRQPVGVIPDGPNSCAVIDAPGKIYRAHYG